MPVLPLFCFCNRTFIPLPPPPTPCLALPADLARLAGPKSRSHLGAEKSVRLAVGMLIKTVLQVGGRRCVVQGVLLRACPLSTDMPGKACCISLCFRQLSVAVQSPLVSELPPHPCTAPAVPVLHLYRPDLPCSTSRWCRGTATFTPSGRRCCRRCRSVQQAHACSGAVTMNACAPLFVMQCMRPTLCHAMHTCC